jgi:hypothetical protein
MGQTHLIMLLYLRKGLLHLYLLLCMGPCIVVVVVHRRQCACVTLALAGTGMTSLPPSRDIILVSCVRWILFF